MLKPYVVNIQKYAIHDGEGIRTTIFFKGCALRCLWCHNPETQSFQKGVIINYDKCQACGFCASKCPSKAVTIEEGKMRTDLSACTACGECTMFCPHDCREICGKQYEIKDLLKIVEQDEMFYEQSGGGVTLSGGEVMAQDVEYVEELARRIKERGFNLCIDTCGYAPTRNYQRILPHVDRFLYDLKIIDPKKHIEYTGKTNELIFKNLMFLNEHGADINIRIPVIGSVNDDQASINEIITFLKDRNIQVSQVNLLPYHNAGTSKYPRIGREYEGGKFYTPAKERMEEIKQTFIDNSFSHTKIGG